MKIIFLDIDGVLNSDLHYQQVDRNLPYEKKSFNIQLVNNLNSITDKTGAKIVLSSTWRKNRSLDDLKELFKRVGITGELIDKTPVLEFDPVVDMSVPRGCEIQLWINENKNLLSTNILNWKDYVIIDDDSDMLYWHRKNFFQTDRTVGLSPILTYKIINFLK